MTAKERMLERLAGMDVQTVFNIDGTGTIDEVVLTRSLKAFDSTVFTDENIEELIQIGRPDDGGPIVLRVLGDFVQSKVLDVSEELAPQDGAILDTSAPGAPVLETSAPGSPGSPAPESEEGQKAPLSPKAMQRLGGMNVLRALDVDGTGTINKEVLISSLEIFDPVVFTDESIAELLSATARPHQGERPRSPGGGELIYIQDIAMFLGAPVVIEFNPSRPERKPEAPEERRPEVPRLELRRPTTAMTAATSIRSGASCPPSARSELDLEGDYEPVDLESEHMRQSAVRFKLPHVSSADLGGSRGCEIAQPELRGVTLRQLRSLADYVRSRCEPDLWCDSATGQRLTPETVQLHHLAEYVLRPLTQERRCSYVEMIGHSAEDQYPRWYATWAGGSFLDLVHCLMEHSRRHSFGGRMSYWVSAFASDPWNDELFTAKTTWQRALEISHGSVQVIGSGPVPYIEVADQQVCGSDTFVS